MIALYGTNSKSVELFDYLKEKKEDVIYVKEMESRFWKDVSPSIELEEMFKLYSAGKIEKIIVRFECFPQLLDRELVGHNVDFADVYVAFHEDSGDFRLALYNEAEFMPYLEYHVADHCNMNCKYCEHYSGLCQEEVFADPEKLINDLKQLKKYIKHIRMIRILGGEPLLHKELNKFIEGTRNLYPDSNIHIVTNGLLIKQVPDEVYKCICDNNASVIVSYYPPLKGHIDDIRKHLEEKGVKHFISQLMDYFTCKQVLEPHNDEERIFRQCYQATCHNLYDGKLGVCFLPFMTKYFNEYYGKCIPNGECIDLYDEDLSLEKILQYLHKPIERCRYCTEPVVKTWGRVKHPSDISDWVNI